MRPSLPAGSPPTPDFLPTLEEIRRYFAGAARLMGGQSDGLQRLDLSADGFWRSFAALLVALPPSILSWIEFERVERAGGGAGTALDYLAHATADATAWLVPILIMMSAAPHIGFTRKIVPFVVALNWGGALMAWIFSPFFLLVLLLGPSDTMQALGLVVAGLSVVLTVRLVAHATQSDLPLAIAIVTMMVIVALMSYAAVSDIFGIRIA